MAYVAEALTLQASLTVRGLFGVWQELRKNPSAVLAALVVGVYIVIAVFGSVIAPYPPNETALADRLQEPSGDHWLGTDGLGRDILSRCIYGARVSILIGFLSVTLCVFFGVSLGLIAGYYRGRLDSIFSRMSEILMAFPYLISAIAMMR